MSDYTPTTEDIRESYCDEPDRDRFEDKYLAEFNRWLAEHDRQIAAAAWDEGYEDARADEHEHRPGRKHTNPYRREATE